MDQPDRALSPDPAIGPTPWLGDLVSPLAACLRTPAQEVADVRDVLPYVARMQHLMLERGGVGLAAPQCGVSLRFFVSTVKGCKVVINPRIVKKFGSNVSKPEGCLTWPGKSTYAARSECIGVRFTQLSGEETAMMLEGLNARIFQHETDHLNGICIFPA